MKKIYSAVLVISLMLSCEAFSQSCQANFTYAINGQNVFITNKSTYTGAPYMDLYAIPAVHYSSGTPFDTLTVRYTIKGKYQICLNVHDPDTSICNSTYCDSVDIVNAPVCQAKIGFLYPYFYDNSYGTSKTTKYKWDMGDGFQTTKEDFNHGYAVQGTYNICLTITDTVNGCSSTVCLPYIFLPVQCKVELTPITTRDSTVYFISKTEPWQFHPIKYWEYGDGSFGNLSYHKYNSAGTYNVCLTTSDTTLNCSTQKVCTTVTVKGNENCSPYFRQEHIWPTTVHFNTGFINTKSIKYFWNFGDGSTGEGINIKHQYPAPMMSTMYSYNTCLVVRDTISGCSDSACQVINVGIFPIGIKPVPEIFSQDIANLNIFPLPFTNGLNIQFTLNNNSPLAFTVYNYQGQKVYEEAMGKQLAGEKNITLQTSGLTNGVYLLQIKTNEKQVTKRIIKQ
ncbi:MAG: PKD domain-containing protein [Bacteroidetes bacterium]|nr:PKD domain-containing protein [Bacteroidota bacterium]